MISPVGKFIKQECPKKSGYLSRAQRARTGTLNSAAPMRLPLLIVPPGGIKVVALPKLASHLFAPYETAWAWGAKLAAANALSAFEVSALLGLSATIKYPLVPAGVPGVARILGKKLDLPSHQIESAFFGGALKFLHPLVCEHLRLCPVCSRLGYHFVTHQLRPFTCCPLHDVPLRERCLRCGELLVYDLGGSTVHGPITCPACRAPQLPVSRGGYPRTSVISAQTVTLIARWLTFFRQRATDPVLFKTPGVIDADRFDWTFRSERIQVFRPPKSAGNPILPPFRGHWSDEAQYKCLEMCYWEQAKRFWRKMSPTIAAVVSAFAQGPIRRTGANSPHSRFFVLAHDVAGMYQPSPASAQSWPASVWYC